MTLTVSPSPHVSSVRPSRTLVAASYAPRLRAIARAAVPPLVFCLLLALGWEAMVTWNPSPLLPHLSEVADEVRGIVANGDAGSQIGITLWRILLGFGVAYGFAIGIGLLSARNKTAKAFFEPALVLGLTVPGLVWSLLCVIWFGLSLKASVIAIALGVAPALALSIIQGVSNVDPQLIEAAHVYRLSRIAILRHLWIPAIMPHLLGGARLGFSLAWKVVVLVEIFGLSSGVGYRLNSAFSSQNVAAVLAWTIVFAVMMAVIEYGVMQTVERSVTRWKRAASV